MIPIPTYNNNKIALSHLYYHTTLRNGLLRNCLACTLVRMYDLDDKSHVRLDYCAAHGMGPCGFPAHQYSDIAPF